MRSYVKDYKGKTMFSLESNRQIYRGSFFVGGVMMMAVGLFVFSLAPAAGLFSLLGGAGITAYAIIYFRKNPK